MIWKCKCGYKYEIKKNEPYAKYTKKMWCPKCGKQMKNEKERI